MDTVLLVKAAIMGIVEGLTEFLPISSTGHLILAGSLLDFTGAKAKVFEIAIQTGAILAVIIVYWQKIRATLVALIWHAWVGVRNVWMDYVKPDGLRLVFYLVTIFWLVACAGWGVQVLWRL